MSEYFTAPADIVAGVRARSAKINEIIQAVEDGFDALPGGLDALTAGSGILVSSDDTSIGYLDGKLLEGDAITFTVGNPAGDETLTISVEDDAITYAKMQDISIGSALLGNITTAAGATTEVTVAQAQTLLNVEDGADVTDATNVASTIHGVAGKTTPIDADEVGLIDSAASNSLKVLTWANLKATIKSYYDSVSTTMTNKTLTSPVLNTGVSGTAIKDEDDMASDSNMALATQQSIKAYVDEKLPVGSEIIWPGTTPPTGYLEEDGSAISRTAYADLYALIDTEHGVGDGSTTFNVPDARGKSIRVWDHGAGNDPGAAVSIVGDTHSNTTIDSLPDTSVLEAGMLITGTGIPAATTISSIDSSVAITISQAATATASDITFSCTNRTDRGDGTTGDTVGTDQAGGIESHTHLMSTNSIISNGESYYTNRVWDGTNEGTASGPQSDPMLETRMINTNRMLCIKY